MACSAYTCLDVCKNHLLIFSSFLDIWENVEWPRFFGPPAWYIILNITRNSHRHLFYVADSNVLSSKNKFDINF